MPSSHHSVTEQTRLGIKSKHAEVEINERLNVNPVLPKNRTHVKTSTTRTRTRLSSFQKYPPSSVSTSKPTGFRHALAAAVRRYYAAIDEEPLLPQKSLRILAELEQIERQRERPPTSKHAANTSSQTPALNHGHSATRPTAFESHGNCAQGLCSLGVYGAKTCSKVSNMVTPLVVTRITGRLPRRHSKQARMASLQNPVIDLRRKLSAESKRNSKDKSSHRPPLNFEARTFLNRIKKVKQAPLPITLDTLDWFRTPSCPFDSAFERARFRTCSSNPAEVSKPNRVDREQRRDSTTAKNDEVPQPHSIAKRKSRKAANGNAVPISQQEVRTVSGGYKRKREVRFSIDGGVTAEPSLTEQFVEGPENSPSPRKRQRAARPEPIAPSGEL